MSFLDNYKNTVRYSAEINIELNKEFLERTAAAAPGFFMASVWVIYNQFESIKYYHSILVLGWLLLLTSSIRSLVIFLYKKNKLSFEKAVNVSTLNVFINGVLWALTVLLPIFEFEFKNPAADVTILGLIFGFVMASIITLGFNLILAYFFQWILILPATAYLYYLAVTNQNGTAFNGAVVMTIAVLYIFNQTRIVHRQTVNRIINELELKKREQELISEKAKLQHSVRLAAIGEISAEVAHEINNPLGLIYGYIELSIDDLKNKNVELSAVTTKLEKAKNSISRITKIIKGLRLYSRATANEPPVLTYFNEILDDVMDFCSEKISYYNIQLEVKSQQDSTLNCRPIEISQVLLNLITNAIEEVTKLDIAERKIKIEQFEVSGQLRVHISNSGPKISEDIRGKIFEPFFSTKKIGVGTGLGLSISKNIIEAHGGRLFYDPQMPNSTFVVELPLI